MNSPTRRWTAIRRPRPLITWRLRTCGATSTQVTVRRSRDSGHWSGSGRGGHPLGARPKDTPVLSTLPLPLPHPIAEVTDG